LERQGLRRMAAEMWNKRRQAEVTAAPIATLSLESGKDHRLMSDILVVEANPYAAVGAATIGKTVKLVGQLDSKEDLFVDGNLEGTIEAVTHKGLKRSHIRSRLALPATYMPASKRMMS
jgi:hypothetical protein